MGTQSVFRYIGENLFSLLTVLLGCMALGLSQLEILPPGMIGKTTLAIVIFLATSQLVDNARKLDRLESAVQDGIKETISAVGGVRVIPLSEADTGLRYLAQQARGARSRIDHVSLSPPISRGSVGAAEWEKAIDKALLSNTVRYRYVCVFSDPARLERVRRHLSNPKVTKYFVGHFRAVNNVPPMLNFMIVDNEEVIAIFPYAYGEPEEWVSVRHPDIVSAFASYFQRLWDDSEKLTGVDLATGLLDEHTE